MSRPSSSFGRWLLTLAGVVALSLALSGCPGGDGVTAQADADIGVLQIGVSTVFRVTVNGATGLTGATTFNLIGGEETTARAPFGQQVENYVVNTDTITLAIYDAGGSMLGYASIAADTYAGSYSGPVTLTRGTTTAGYVPTVTTVRAVVPVLAVEPLQTGQLDVLATGLIENVDRTGTFTNVVIPLYCGGATGPFSPGADGFFIINDAAIEFNYAFNNPTAFNDVLTIKFVESGRSFDNMQLYFKLPGAGRPLVNARTGTIVPSGSVPGIYAGVGTFVNSSNPFETAQAIADLTITPFGPARLVETTVTSVQGDCVLGAKSFYVIESQETPDPDAIKAIGERFDKNTLEDSLVLLILGDEVDTRDQVLDQCDQWTAAQSGGFGTTVDTWDISAIPSGAVFDFRFNAFSIPDKYIVEYPLGSVVLDTGWRGSSSYEGDPKYPGGIAGPGSGEELGIFTRGAVSSFKVTVIGVDTGTAWNYSVRCRQP